MATDREIGDLVARFRLIVDEKGVKEGALALDRLEKKAAGSAIAVESVGRRGSSGMFGIATAATAAVAGVAKLTDLFLDAGEAGKLTGEQRDRYLALDSATTELTDAVTGLSNEFISALAPTLITVADLAVDLIGHIESLGDKSSTLGKIFKGLNEAVGQGDVQTDFYKDLDKSLFGVEKSTVKAAVGKRELARRAKEAATELDLENKRLSEQEKRFRAVIDAQVDEVEASLKVIGARLSLKDADAAVVEAQKKVQEASKRGAEFAEREATALDKVGDAQNAVTQARFKATRTADDLAEKENALAEAKFRFGEQSIEADEAGDDLVEAQEANRQANVDVGESIEDVTTAERDYQRALADGRPTVEKTAEATRNLEKAQLAVKQAQLDSAAAQTALSTKQAEANGLLLTGAQYAKLYADNLALAGVPIALDGLRRGSSVTDGGGSGAGSFDSALGSVVNNYITVTATNPTEAAKVIGEEIDWSSRVVIGGGAGAFT